MANLEAIKARLNSLKTKGKVSTQAEYTWKPEPGKTRIRIVPYKHNSEMPFSELKFHYNLGNRTYLSPSTVGDPDPVVELVQELRLQGDKDSYKLSRTLEPKMRTYVPIVIRGRESEGVKFWAFGKMVYEELLGYFADPDYGDLSDPQTGRDIEVEYKTAEETGTSYPSTDIRVKPGQTVLTDSEDVLKKLANQPKLIGEVFQMPTYEELQQALENWLNNDESKDKADSDSKDAGNDLPFDSSDFPEASGTGSNVTDDISKRFAMLVGKG